MIDLEKIILNVYKSGFWIDYRKNKVIRLQLSSNLPSGWPIWQFNFTFNCLFIKFYIQLYNYLELGKTNPLMYNIKHLKWKSPAIRLKIVVQTDRQTESISECILKDLSNDIWHAYQSWKLVGDEENNIPPPLH